MQPPLPNMLTIATWKWNGTREFTSQHVNALFRAVADNLTLPHRFVCITDDASGLDDNITVVPLPEFDHIKVRPGFPSCYIRLKAFEPEFAKTIGERILTLDLDTVITGDITPLVDRDEDLVLWRCENHRKIKYQGGMHLMNAGARPQVWSEFKGEESYEATKRLGLVGSDQAWLTHVLPDDETCWVKEDGIAKTRDCKRSIPAWARIVHFSGLIKPWTVICKDQYPHLHNAWSKYANIRK